MYTKDVIKELKEAKNIYDILVILYGYIDDEHSPERLQEYDRISQDRNWKDVNRLLDELLKDEIDFRSFLEEIQVLLEKDSSLYAVHILQYFNQIFKDKREYSHLGFGNRAGIGVMDELGPLNTIRDKYRLYLSPESSLLKESKAMKASKYRLISYRDGSGIFARIDSYYITSVSGQNPEVFMKGYQKDIFFKGEEQEKSIRIACMPLCRENWFDVTYIDNASGANYFEIVNENPHKEDINKAYLALFESLIEEKVEIAIFPELSMNERTEREITEYLIEKSLRMKDFPLKLVFLGSLWKDKKNECVLLSGNGSVLCRNRKKNPFELEKEGKKYKEALDGRPIRYETVDIPRFGRVLYLVCKDAFDGMAQAVFHNEYEVNFEVISSYSKSVSLFGDQTRDLAEKHLGIGVIANSCCPRAAIGEKEIGFIEIPYMRKKKPYKLEGMPDRYEMDDECMGQCSFAKCLHIFDFKPDRLKEDCERAGITVDYTRKLLK